MTDSPTEVLVAFAKERGVKLTVRGARKLVDERGAAAAEYRIASVGSLLDLAGALGVDLTQAAALRWLDIAGSYEGASSRLIEGVRGHRQRVFNRAWEVLEAEHFSRDARARYASLMEAVASGPLGYQAMMLIAAARDAELADPSGDAYRASLVRIVDSEIDRRYPNRPEDEWQVVDPDSRHKPLLDQAIREEKDARDLVLARRPELQQRIDAMSASAQMRNDIGTVLGKIRRRLATKIEQGWHPAPDRYRHEVIEAAADAARVA